MLVSNALLTDSINVLAARATSTHHLQTYHPQTHTSMYHTMRLDVMMSDDTTTICGVVDE